MNIVPEGKRSGVLLVNTGTPTVPKPRAVRKYLAKFLMDKRIAPMNRAGWWFVLHLFILPKRGRASAEKYQKIWTDEGSPFTIAHQKLEAGLGAAFEDEGLDVAVRCAMSYSDPSVLDCVRELKGAGCTRLIVLPLYPQSAYSTTGSVSDSVERALKKARWDVPCDFVDNYHDDPTYIRAIAASIEHAGFKVDSDDKVLFSYHSIPLVDIEAGDTYELQTGATSLQVASELGIDRNRWPFRQGPRMALPVHARRADALGGNRSGTRVLHLPELRRRLFGDALRHRPRAQAVLFRPDQAGGPHAR